MNQLQMPTFYIESHLQFLIVLYSLADLTYIINFLHWSALSLYSAVF